MSWRLVWSPESRADLHRIGFDIAASVCRAVIRWTETGEGLTELLSGDLVRIVAPRAGFAVVRLDEGEGAFQVLRVYANHSLPCIVPLLDEPDDDVD